MKNIKNNDIAIQLTNVSKEYVIHHEKPTLVEKFVKTAKFQKVERFWALKNINLSIKRGERIGIIGPNGAGKTTLLKIISGVTTPTTGTIKKFGRLVSLIDLEAGFHEDLTGYQNIYINGLLLGLTKKEINRKMNDIIEYAGIRQFIDTPLFTYSSGMKLRLGFSIAIHAQPDTLVIDEGFITGDEQFRKKTLKLLNELNHQSITILLVSHWLSFIKLFCQKVIYITEGKIEFT
jgi:ABC-type polysaccharide/polyol phosphate transport system ATPase subunit